MNCKHENKKRLYARDQSSGAKAWQSTARTNVELVEASDLDMSIPQWRSDVEAFEAAYRMAHALVHGPQALRRTDDPPWVLVARYATAMSGRKFFWHSRARKERLCRGRGARV